MPSAWRVALYDISVAKYGYITATETGITISPPSNVTRNFVLSAEPVLIVSGTVRDAATSWPLYARIDIAGYPNGPVFTDPATGFYQVALVAGSYTVTVTAMSGGYDVVTEQADINGDMLRNYQLSVNSLTCTAPGYQQTINTPFFSEGFDAAVPPALPSGWAAVDTAMTAGDWTTGIVSSHPAGIIPHSSPIMAIFNSYTTFHGKTRLQQTSGLDLSTRTNAEVSYWMYHESEYTEADSVLLQLSTDAGATWVTVGQPVFRSDGSTGWKRHAVGITPYTGPGMTDVRIGLLGDSAYGNDIHIDDVAVSPASECTPLPAGGLVIGTVRDANTGTTVLNASVSGADLSRATQIDASADPAVPARLYVIAQSAGTRTLTASSQGYGSGQAAVDVIAGSTVSRDIALSAGLPFATPVSLSFYLTTDAPAASQPLSLGNDGGAALSFDILPILGIFSGYAPVGPFADNTRHLGPKNLNDTTARSLRADLAPTGIATLAAGNVSGSLETGLPLPWGIGYNTGAGDFWLGNIADNTDYRFTGQGIMTGDTIKQSWATLFAADMSYNPVTKTLWQVNVGGDNCIHELNPATRSSTGARICPPFGSPQRGLAYDPLTDTYYSGSWNDTIINHFAPNGTIIDSASVGLAISGLAFNPATGHLFVMTNAATTSDPTKFDVYVLDAKAGYAVLGGFNLMNGSAKAFSDYSQAGLELDCSGNLWSVDQTAAKVYIAASGESDVCAWQLSPWVTATPAAGSVAPGGITDVSVSIDASGLASGVYNSYLRITNSAPYGPLIVPITLNLTAMNRLTVTRSGTGAGTVTTSPAGISCGSDCAEAFYPGTLVRLTATPAAGSVFSGWGGEADCADGTIIMDAPKSCSAIFTIKSFTVTGSVIGGNGSLSCSTPVSYGDSSTCTIVPAYGYVLAALTDNGTGVTPAVSGHSYTISGVTADHLVMATFTLIPPLTVPDFTLQGAYDAVADNGSILVRSDTFEEDVVCDRPVVVLIRGGYNVDFTAAEGMSIIEHKLTVRNGKVVVSRLAIKN